MTTGRRDPDPAERPPWAWVNGQLLDARQVSFAADDLGVLQGVIAVERLRSWSGSWQLLDQHLGRWRATAEHLAIAPWPDDRRWKAIIDQVLSHSGAAGLASDVEPERSPAGIDVGLSLLATPGPRGGSEPTLVVRAEPLDDQRRQDLQQFGQPLRITEIQQPAPQCWPRTLKVRSRLHYYLADLQARQYEQDALGVLLDGDGTVTETSTSNLLLVEDGALVMPPQDRVLPGIMKRQLTRMLDAEGSKIEQQPISVQRLREADEVWLTGSLGGLWFASAVDGQSKQPSARLRDCQQRLHAQLTNV